MTQPTPPSNNSSKTKKLIRARMKENRENYTTAMRALEQERLDRVLEDIITDDDR